MSAHLATSFFETVRRAGWSFADAALHFVDNALDAGARHVWVYLRSEGATPNKCVEVLDDGAGLDERGIRLALALGASPTDAGAHGSFGLGMKAAAVALGERLEIVSSPGRGAPFLKRVVRFGEVATTGRYVATDDPLSLEDTVLLESHLPAGRGTLVRVGGVALRSPENALDALQAVRGRAGLVYGLILRDGPVVQVGGATVYAADPIRVDEANADEFDEPPPVGWGSRYRWLVTSRRVLLAPEPRIYGTFEATQRLPRRASDLGRRVLDAPEHDGLYVYRNRRLVATALRPAGLPTDEEGGLFGFRGRLSVTGAADAALGPDLSKVSVALPDAVEEVLCRIATRALKRAEDTTAPI
jgi:hypothetical protein